MSRKQQRQFLACSIAVPIVIFAGFARNYYLRLWIGTRDLTPMQHVHGLVMTTWVLLFLAQSVLVAKHRIDLHRRLGQAGGILAVLVVMLGTFTIVNSIIRQHLDTGLRSFVISFVAFDGLSLFLFGSLVFAGLRWKRCPEIHKRLMQISAIALLPPAFGRIVAQLTHDQVELKVLVLMSFSALIFVCVDTLQIRRMNPASAVSGAIVILANIFTYFAQVAA